MYSSRLSAKQIDRAEQVAVSRCGPSKYVDVSSSSEHPFKPLISAVPHSSLRTSRSVLMLRNLECLSAKYGM